MNYKTKIFLQSLFALVAFGIALQATATWVAPIGTPPTGGNTEPPINGGSTTQQKTGGLVTHGFRTTSVLIAEQDATFNENVTIGSGKTLTINTETYTFPANQTAGGYLKTNGTGTLTWDTSTQGNLTGDVTSVGLATTYAGTVPFGKGGTGLTTALDDTTLVSSGSAWVAKILPDCIDTGGNHLNYNATTNLFSCGTSGGGGGGEANTASNLGGGLANFDSKSGVDLRFNSFTASDFNLASNLISIDYANGQSANGSTKGFLTSTDWTTFNNKVPTTRTISTSGLLSGGGDLSADRTITTSIATNRLVGRSTAGTGVMEEILVGSGLSLSGGTLSSTAGNPSFSVITGGTNTTAAMVVGDGASLVPSGTGIIDATRYHGSGSTTNEVDLATAEVAGTLPVGKGGTGLSSITGGCLLVSQTTGAFIQLCPSNNQSLRRVASGSGWTAFDPVDLTSTQTLSGKTLVNPSWETIGTTGNAANLYFSGTNGTKFLRSTSSIRYKKDITDLEVDTSKIYDLKPISYTSKSDGLRYFGLIAEDVDKVIPALVDYLPEKNVIAGSTSSALIPDSVKYPMLSVLLLKETQKHEAEINELKKENEDLKSRIEALEAKIK